MFAQTPMQPPDVSGWGTDTALIWIAVFLVFVMVGMLGFLIRERTILMDKFESFFSAQRADNDRWRDDSRKQRAITRKALSKFQQQHTEIVSVLSEVMHDRRKNGGNGSASG